MSLEPHSARLLPSVVQPPTIAFKPGNAPTPPDLAALPCPNCGAADPKTLILTVDVQLPDNPAKRLRVLRCPVCTANFYDSQVPPDYAEPALNDRGRVPFYVQQGAGVSLITKPLAQLRRPPGATYMEVGCGYGFGLDFALNTRAWTGLGIDPAPLAALGRDALHLPIELRYLRDDDEARGTMDVVMGSEVIEHVTSPAAFVRTLKLMLKPGGVLILTTPNGDDIDPATPPGIIIPLLSPSLHLVIQNRQSLRALLLQSGFAHVDVDIDSHSLVAFASDSPLDLELDRATLRHALRDHLAHRAERVDPSSDLFLAFAGRAFQESVNDGDLAAADRAWSLLVPACQARFGLPLDSLTALPEAVATCGLEEMARLVPLNLGGLLYSGAIRKLAGGTPRSVLEPQFLLAARAADAMRRALGELAMEDGQTEDIGWTARAEALLCAADAGALDLTARYRALPPAPNGGEARRRSVALRALSNLVNAGLYDAAARLVEGLGLDDAPPDATSGMERDALFALAVLDARMGPDDVPLGNPTRARTRFRQVREAEPAGTGLWWNAVRGEDQALRMLGDAAGQVRLADSAVTASPGRAAAGWAVPVLVNAKAYDEARALIRRFALNEEDGAAGHTPELAFSLAVIDVQAWPDGTPANPARARTRFAFARTAPRPGTPPWWNAVRGEAQALRMLKDESSLSALAEEVTRLLPTTEGARWAFQVMVNAGRYEPARTLAQRFALHDDAVRPVHGAGTAAADDQRDTQFALAVLELQPGGDPARGCELFQRVRRASAHGSPVWRAALRGEMQGLSMLGHTDALAELADLIAHDTTDQDIARIAVPALVNAGKYGPARALALRSGLADAPFAQVGAGQPGQDRTLAPADRDLLFFLAVAEVHLHGEGRTGTEPAVARARFARVRDNAEPGGGLWWAALRGEVQALNQLDAGDESEALLAEVNARHPGMAWPDDLAGRSAGA